MKHINDNFLKDVRVAFNNTQECWSSAVMDIVSVRDVSDVGRRVRATGFNDASLVYAFIYTAGRTICHKIL